MMRRIILALLAVLILSGCGEKRVDGPTVPPENAESTTTATEMTTEATVMTEQIPDVTMPETPDFLRDDQILEVPQTHMVYPELPRLEKLFETMDSDFVLVSDYLPSVSVELQYATIENFTEQVIYDFEDAYLRYGTVKKLELVCQELEQQGLYLKIWDAFRPTQAQYSLWDICPDSKYVANPNTGFSAHSRGNTLDVTLVDADGNEVEMPTGFDDFSGAADRDYSDCTLEAADNAKLLENVMQKHGFIGYWGEWWHFTDCTQYEVETVFDPSDFSWWTPDCDEFITLRGKPDARSEPINRIALGEKFMVLGFAGRFAMADYMGQRGYVLYKYIQPVA